MNDPNDIATALANNPYYLGPAGMHPRNPYYQQMLQRFLSAHPRFANWVGFHNGQPDTIPGVQVNQQAGSPPAPATGTAPQGFGPATYQDIARSLLSRVPQQKAPLSVGPYAAAAATPGFSLVGRGPIDALNDYKPYPTPTATGPVGTMQPKQPIDPNTVM